MVKVWNVQGEETEGVAGRKREISLVTSRDLSLVWLPSSLVSNADVYRRARCSRLAGHQIQKHRSQ
jgi:hypothetical protein